MADGVAIVGIGFRVLGVASAGEDFLEHSLAFLAGDVRRMA